MVIMPVVVVGMLFVSMVIMPVFFVVMVMVMVVVVVMRMVVMIVIVPVVIVGVIVMMVVVMPAMVVAVGLEQGTLAEIQKDRALGLQKRRHRGVPGQRSDRIRHPGGQILADPEHQIRLLQGGRFGGPEVVFMG